MILSKRFRDFIQVTSFEISRGQGRMNATCACDLKNWRQSIRWRAHNDNSARIHSSDIALLSNQIQLALECRQSRRGIASRNAVWILSVSLESNLIAKFCFVCQMRHGTHLLGAAQCLFVTSWENICFNDERCQDAQPSYNWIVKYGAM